MKKKMVALVLSAMMVVSILTGCSKNTGTEDESAEGTAQTSSGEKTQMTLSVVNGGSNEVFAELMQKQVDEFNKSNEYNVEIILEAVPNENYKTKLTTLMASNAQPDIFFTWEAGFLKPMVDGGKVYPVGDILTADAEWYGKYDDKSIFGPVTYDNKIYAVPNTRQVVVLACNKDLFDMAGAKIPDNYSEFLDACDKLKSNGIAPLIVPCTETWYAGQFLQQLDNIVGGEQLYNDTCTEGFEWNNEQFVEGGKMLKNIVDSEYLLSGYLGMTPSEAFEKLNSKEVAMMVMITSGITAIDQGENAEQIEFTLLQSDKEENKGVNVGSIGQTLAISSKAKNPEAAAAFLKSLAGTEYQQAITDLGQVVVTNTKVDTSNLNQLVLKAREVFPKVTLYTPWLDRIYGAGEGVEFNNAAVAIMGGTDPQEAMDNLQQASLAMAE